MVFSGWRFAREEFKDISAGTRAPSPDALPARQVRGYVKRREDGGEPDGEKVKKNALKKSCYDKQIIALGGSSTSCFHPRRSGIPQMR